MTLEESSQKEENSIEISQRLLKGQTYTFIFSENHQITGIPQTSTFFKANGFISIKIVISGIIKNYRIVKINMYWVKEIHQKKSDDPY